MPKRKCHLIGAGSYILSWIPGGKNPTYECYLLWVHEAPERVVNGAVCSSKAQMENSEPGSSVLKLTDVLYSCSSQKGCLRRHTSISLLSVEAQGVSHRPDSWVTETPHFHVALEAKCCPVVLHYWTRNTLLTVPLPGVLTVYLN